MYILNETRTSVLIAHLFVLTTHSFLHFNMFKAGLGADLIDWEIEWFILSAPTHRAKNKNNPHIHVRNF